MAATLDETIRCVFPFYYGLCLNPNPVILPGVDNVTEKTRGLVQRWINAKTNLKRIDREQSSAQCELSNAVNELGKWLVPNDLKQGTEPFNIWFGSGIIQANRTEANNYEIKWRKEPDSKDRW